MASVTLEHVTKRFGETVVVKELDLSVSDKEFVVLVGPSGCGKSTTLRMIAGLEGVTYGTVKIGGDVVNHISPANRDIAMVFQSYALYPHMTVFENMAFGLRLRKTPAAEIKRRVDEAAGLLGVADLLSRKPKQLSGGQRQRVALGRAIVRKPKVFLFDEPLSNLDAKLRGQMRREISMLQRRIEATTVYVTHDQVEAMTMGDRIAVMAEGEIRQYGTPNEIYHHPADIFTAEFIGTPPINLFKGGLTKFSDIASIVETPDMALPLPKAYPIAEAIIGIRPEDLALTSPGRTDLTAEVVFVEPLGGEAIVYTRRGRTELRVKVPGQARTSAGETVGLKVNADKIHVFNPYTGKRLENS